MRLLPEFRKASKRMTAVVKFGTVDCTIHAGLCRQVGFLQLCNISIIFFLMLLTAIIKRFMLLYSYLYM